MNTNGYITFGSSSSSVTISLSTSTRPVVAPFAADTNTVINGIVSYELIYQFDTDSSLLDVVSSHIRANQSVSFVGREMVVVYYNDVAMYLGSSSQV